MEDYDFEGKDELLFREACKKVLDFVTFLEKDFEVRLWGSGEEKDFIVREYDADKEKEYFITISVNNNGFISIDKSEKKNEE